MRSTPNSLKAHRAYLSLGSNIGDKRRHLAEARALLESSLLRVTRASSIYQTSPVDYLAQDWFLNQVIAVETALSPTALLSHCRAVENKMGRLRPIDKGPRVIDIDILFYDDEIISLPDLTVPHLRVAERKFVLVPMVEIAPDFFHPVYKKSMQQLLAERDSDPAEVRLA